MQHSQLVKMYAFLSKKEKKAFRKFVQSPIYNQHEQVILLAEYLENAQNQADLLHRKTVFAALFPNEPFQFPKLRHIMSYLLKVLKEYLTFLELEVEPMEKRLLLTRALRKRGMEKMFVKESQDSRQFQENQPFKNTKYHYHNYLLSLEEYQFRHEKTRSSESNIEELSNELSTFFLSDTLRRSCAALSHSSFSKKEYSIKLLPEVLQHLQENNYENVPAISLYFHSYQALTRPDEEQHFKKLKQLMQQHIDHFPKGEMRDIYLLAINHCIFKMNKGSEQFLREGFELYQSGLKNELLLENGFLSPFTYKNVAIIGLKLQEFAWVENYLEQYKKYLRPDTRENIYTYNLAHYYFRTDNFSEAMKLLQQTDFEDVLHNLDARRMLLRMYFELEEYEALESLLESFTTFIRRKKIGYHGENYLNLIKFTRRLLALPHFDKKGKRALIEQIKNEENLAEKSWLLGQLA